MLLAFLALAHAADRNADGKSTAVIPGAFYSQETSVGFALFGSRTFPIGGEATWPSTIAAAAVVTLEKQASLALWPTLHLGHDNAWAVEGEGIVEHFPTRFYGIGPDTDGGYELFTRRTLSSDVVVFHRIWRDVSVGGVHHVRGTDIRDAALDAPGGDGSIVHGIGIAARIDGRDNDQSTREGAFADARFTTHLAALGSDSPYDELVLDTRVFHSFGPDITLAAQWLTELRRGDVSFTSMSVLGGDRVLRGMYEGRYRDASMSVLQGEVRFPIVWRFRGCANAGMGQVFDDLAAIERDAKWTAGGGLRYELDAESRSVIRADAGGGPEGGGFLLQFGEAF